MTPGTKNEPQRSVIERMTGWLPLTKASQGTVSEPMDTLHLVQKVDSFLDIPRVSAKDLEKA